MNQTASSGYWPTGEQHPNYCWEDQLNDQMWSQSAAVQRLIQGPQELNEEGCFGSQQAMIGGRVVLPWPPDILGANWSKPGSLLIIGSAYAGFIREFSGRSASMPLRDYDPNLTWQEFKVRFLRDVVALDSVYYGGLATLLSGVLPVQSIATFDMCRASFVERGNPIRRKDRQGDGVVRRGRRSYWRYFEDPNHKEPESWIWSRIMGTNATAIVVLGRIAEHGFLRLATRRGFAVEIFGEGAVLVSTEMNEGRWVNKYALACLGSTPNPAVSAIIPTTQDEILARGERPLVHRIG